MKNLKKFAALLLAGAMALLMLTACGGGGGSVNNPEEQKVMSLIRDQKGAQVTSDAELRATAEKHLREDMKGGFQSLETISSLPTSIWMPRRNDYAIVTVTASYVYSDTLLSALLKAIEASTKVPIGVKGNVKQNGTWSKVGIVILSRHRAELHRPVYPGREPPQVNNNFSSFLPGVWLQSCPPGLFCAGWQGRGSGPFLRCDKSCR